MRTLLVTLEFPPFKGGIANYYGHLANYWPIAEHLTVLDNNQGELLFPRGFLAWRPALWALNRRLEKGQVDYVLIGHILPLGTVAWILSWFRSTPYAIFLHGLDFSSATRTWRKRLLTRLILRRADKIICANTYVAAKVEKFYPNGEKKISVINPGVSGGIPRIDTARLAELNQEYSLEGKTVILSLGRLVRRKGVDQAIKAMTTVPEPLIHDLRYFIAGAGPDEKYLRDLVPPRYMKNIVFLGQLSEEEKWLWLNRTDIFLMPARDIAGDFEGFGIVYLEANLCGKPVIAGRAGGVGDAVIDSYNGLMVDPENPDDIKRAIIELASDPARRGQLGKQGQARALTEFNWEKQAAKVAAALSFNNES
jgi:phosphatidylinositol alpha-1,6-mannosyltransferase